MWMLIPLTIAALLLLRRKKKMMQAKTDVETQLEMLESDIAASEELLGNLEQFKANLFKMRQRRNQLKILVDIQHGKLRVHRTDTGAMVPVRFW